MASISAKALRLKQIQEAKIAADKGEVISHKDMKAWAHSLDDNNASTAVNAIK